MSSNGVELKNKLHKDRYLLIRFLSALICMAFFCAFLSPIKANATQASGRWITSESSTDAPEVEDKDLQPQEDVNSVEKMIADAIVSVVNFIVGAVSNNDGGIDASTTGIIMGTVTNDDGNSIFVFSLNDNNIYGIIGATIYVVLRTISMMFVFILTLWAVVKKLFTSKPGQGLTDLKQALYDAVLALAFLYYAPYLVDYVCVARDYFITVFYSAATDFLGEASFSDITSLETVYRENFEAVHSLANALVYALIAFIPIKFLISYIQIAIQQTVLFGMFPAFCISGMSNKKNLSNWLSLIVSNAFIPPLDTLLICFCLMIKTTLDSMLDTWSGTFLSAVIIMTMYHSIVPVRNEILKMLGGAIGVSMGGKGGFSALASLGAGVMDDISKTLGKGKGGGTPENDKNSDSENAGGNSDLKSEADKGIQTAKNPAYDGEGQGSGEGSEGAVNEGGSSVKGEEAGTGGAENNYSGGWDEEKEQAANTLGYNDDDSSSESVSEGGVNDVSENASGVGFPPPTEGSFDRAAEADYAGIEEQAQERANAMYGGDEVNKNLYMQEQGDRASNLAEMDTLNRSNSDMAVQDAQTQLDISDAKNKMDSNSREIAKKEEELSKLQGGDSKSDIVLPGGKSSGADRQNQLKSDIDKLKTENEQHRSTIEKGNRSIAENRVKKAENDRSIKEKTEIEKGFAHRQEQRGFDGTSYRSAADFKAALTKQNNIVKATDYNNFNRGETKGVLSDKEVKKYSADAKRREALKAVGYGAAGVLRTAGKVAGTAAFTAGAYVATAGLDEEKAASIMKSAGKLGGTIGSGVTGAATKGVAKGTVGAIKGGKAVINNVNSRKSTPPGTGGDGPQTKGGDGGTKPSTKKMPNGQTSKKELSVDNGGNGKKSVQQSSAGGVKNGGGNASTNKEAYRRIENKRAQRSGGQDENTKKAVEQREFVNQYQKEQAENSKRNAEKANRIDRR